MARREPRNPPSRRSIRAMAIFHQLTNRAAQDPTLKVVGGIKPRANAHENAAAETNPLSTLPKSWPSSAAAADEAATQ